MAQDLSLVFHTIHMVIHVRVFSSLWPSPFTSFSSCRPCSSSSSFSSSSPTRSSWQTCTTPLRRVWTPTTSSPSPQYTRCQRRRKKTENKCCASMACGWCVAQTLLLTRVAKTTSTWRLSALPTTHSRCQGSVWSTLWKQFVLALRDPHLLWKTPPNSLPNGLPSSPAQVRHSHLRTNYKQFWLKANTVQIESQPANHARSSEVHHATHAETMHTVWIVTQTVSRLQNKEFAGIQPSCVTSSRHNHRCFRFQLRSAPLWSIQFAFDQSSICFLPKLVRLRNHAEFGYLTHFWPDALTSGVQRSPTQSTRLVLNHFCCCWDCCNCWKLSKDPRLSADCGSIH